MDTQERARMRQREFYLEQAKRFERMADEFSPQRHAENELPIHGYTAVIVLHGSDAEELASEAHSVGMNFSYDTHGRDTVAITGGRHSIWMERPHPEQTPENYEHELKVWAAERRAARS